MSKTQEMFEACNAYIKRFENAIENPVRSGSSVYYTGVDLGTACVVMAVLDENSEPVAGAYEYADVVKDGMVVDYFGAIQIVSRMKTELEAELGTELEFAACAIPPGTDSLDGGAVKNVVQACGFEVTAVMDEPTAANVLLKITDGAVVDIGGGTTGVSVFKEGKLVKSDDEATGGTHFSLVLAGSYRKSFQEAELMKRDFAMHDELYPLIRPVVEKISTIILRMINGQDVDKIVLVGGSSLMTGIEDDIENMTGISTYKPLNPLFVTPLGIALSCRQG